MEIENNNSSPSLDVLVIRLLYGCLGYSVYRKSPCLAKSHHHPAQKLSVVIDLVHRAISISEEGNLHKELNHLYETLQNKGY